MTKEKRYLLIMIWSLLMGIHAFIAVVYSGGPNPGIILIYATVAMLSKTGLPVFLNPHSGWGWPTPNSFGWFLAVAIWAWIYFFLARRILGLVDRHIDWKKWDEDAKDEPVSLREVHDYGQKDPDDGEIIKEEDHG